MGISGVVDSRVGVAVISGPGVGAIVSKGRGNKGPVGVGASVIVQPGNPVRSPT